MTNTPDRHVVIRKVARAPSELVDRLAPFGSATVYEAIGRRGYLGPDITPIQRGVRIAGTAVTVLNHPGDNLMIHAAVEMCQAGDILVVATTAPASHGMFGDLLASSLKARDVRGLVIDAGVRDTADLRAMGFAVWSRWVSCQGTEKATPGSVNVPITIGGVTVNPGDVVIADDDGVVVVAGSEAEWALERSAMRLEREDATRLQLEGGELGVDIYGLRHKLEELGVEYLDSIDDLE